MMPFSALLKPLAAASVIALGTSSLAGAQDTPAEISEGEDLVRQVLTSRSERREALEVMRQRGDLDVVAGLIQGVRFMGFSSADVVGTLQDLTGETELRDWHDWMLWQEAHPEVVPFDGFEAVKADVFATIDPNFRLFLRRGIEHEIRIEEITWGGVIKDGIPALVNATQIAPGEADYLTDDELVFGVSINGDARAYPLRILDWHEMFNDVVGGVPVALAYCTLCGSGILYDMRVEGFDEPFEFGSSGFLYRSNKLMYDQGTHSLWNQFTGRPVVGDLTGSGIELKTLPVAITSWANWFKKHPDSTVLSLDTGFSRDYSLGAAYSSYFNSPDLMFPAQVPSDALEAKDFVFALRNDVPGGDGEKAWPLEMFDGGAVVNDGSGDLDIVLVGDSATRTVRAYDAGGRDFSLTDDPDVVTAEGMDWRVDEDALVASDGTEAPRLAGHVAYWFAFANFLEGKPLAGS